MSFHQAAPLLTLQSDAVHGEGPGQLGGHLHAAADQGLSKHVLEGLVIRGAVAQLADHRDGILVTEQRTVMNSFSGTISPRYPHSHFRQLTSGSRH